MVSEDARANKLLLEIRFAGFNANHFVILFLYVCVLRVWNNVSESCSPIDYYFLLCSSVDVTRLLNDVTNRQQILLAWSERERERGRAASHWFLFWYNGLHIELNVYAFVRSPNFYFRVSYDVINNSLMAILRLLSTSSPHLIECLCCDGHYHSNKCIMKADNDTRTISKRNGWIMLINKVIQ